MPQAPGSTAYFRLADTAILCCDGVAKRQEATVHDEPGSYASPPCFLHELDPGFAGVTDAQTRTDLVRWRKAERARLIGLRQAVPVAVRQIADALLARELDSLLGDTPGQTIGLYWPFKGEPDLRYWAAARRAAGARLALPVVVDKAAPLVFREWKEEAALTRGVWNIPIPPDGAESVLPDIVIAAVVGFDAANFRLGYGGGYYDRTLAMLHGQGHRPRTVGVGYRFQQIATIYPQSWDVPLDQAILAET